MRKIILWIHVSLDGFVAGPNGEMDWIIYNDEMEAYAHQFHNFTDTAIYGRVTYEMMESYWSTVLDNPESTAGDIAHATWLENATKIIVSRTLSSVDWGKTILIKDKVKEEIERIKEQPGKDIWLLGSPTLARSFMQLGLIDEYRICVNPVVLGKGKPFFTTSDNIHQFELIEAKTFTSGVVCLRYQPK